MLAWSLAAHAGIMAFLLFGPMDWRLGADETPRTVMTISLAGAPGPRAGGMTPIGGRAVPIPHLKPCPAPCRRRRRNRGARCADPDPRDAAGAAAAEEEPQTGVTRTETGARGQGFGLSTGGGGGSGVQLDVANFCCPEYIQQMVTLIQQNWQPNQGVAVDGDEVHYHPRRLDSGRDGRAAQRVPGARLAAERALLTTRLPELPPQFPNPSLPVHVTFDSPTLMNMIPIPSFQLHNLTRECAD